MGRSCLGLALVALLSTGSASALELPATRLAYRIEVELDPEARSLFGRQEVRWAHPAGRPLAWVALQLYLEAFRNAGTTWMRGADPGWIDPERWEESYGDPWGWIDVTALHQRARGERWPMSLQPIQPDDGNPLDRTLCGAVLPVPVEPGEEAVLELEFSARLPVPFARTGCVPGYCFLAQWFPKLAVMEPPGVRGAEEARWVLHQFHAPTEFYADFADYDVTMRVPGGWLVAATGRADDLARTLPDGRQEVSFSQRAVHDFAWLAGRDLVETVHRHRPAGRGGEVAVRYVHPVGFSGQADRARIGVEAALDHMGLHVGPYPYDVLTVVLPPGRGGRTGGMEYPTLITAMPADPQWDRFPFSTSRVPELVAIHEFIHQYFYGVVATEEREEAFLDEGLTTYWEGEVLEALFPAEAGGGRLLGRTIEARAFRTLSLEGLADGLREPIRRRPAFLQLPHARRAQIYNRPALLLASAKGLFGERALELFFRDWYRRGAFAHPDVEGLLRAAELAGGADLAAFLREGVSQPRVPEVRATLASTRRWRPPLGHLPGAEGGVRVTAATREEQGDVGLDPRAAETDGRLLLEVVDPGWDRGGEREQGRIERRQVEPARVAVRPAGGDAWYDSRARVEGPGWDHWPVHVELTFDDGALVREPWDGRAAWREYRVVRRARLVDVRVGPDDRLAADPRPQDNALRVEPEPRALADWSAWLGAAAAWAAAGISLWL